MSEKKVKTYTAEFKESAVKLAVESNQPVTFESLMAVVQVACIHCKRTTNVVKKREG